VQPFPQKIGARVFPDKTLQVLLSSPANSAEVSPAGLYQVRVGVDKTGMEPVAMRIAASSSALFSQQVLYKGVLTNVDGPGFIHGIDFGSDGTLYIMDRVQLWRLTQADLANGGSVALSLVGQISPRQGPTGGSLVVGCDNLGYMARNDFIPDYPFTQISLFQFDVTTAQVIAVQEFTPGQYINNLALTCRTNELWGSMWLDIQVNDSMRVWRMDTSSGLGPPEPVVDLPVSGNSGWISIAASGNLYISNPDAILIKRGAVSPCDGGSALPRCMTGHEIEILPPSRSSPSTTRWKPQRATDPADSLSLIKIAFKGPSDLDLTTVRLEVTPPPEFLGTYTPTIGAVTKTQGKDDEYTFDWTGPWTYTGSSGTQLMPRGNYKLVVAGKRQNSDTELKNDPPYDKVSLVEVKEVRFEEMAGAPALDGNPAMPPLVGESAERGRSAEGRRIFPEAVEPLISGQPAPPVFDAVRVVATLEPGITDAPTENPVKVFFRAVDVDDPSANGGLDDEGKDRDNRGDFNASGVAIAGLFRGEPSGTPDAPIGIALDKAAEAGGAEARVMLRVSRRQGDNYRLVASTSVQWVKDVQALQKTDLSGKKGLLPGAVEHKTDGSLQGNKQVSDMLTVWRTLHLEEDRLYSSDPEADQARMDVRGNFTKLEDKSLEDGTGPFEDDPKVDKDRLNDWVLHEKPNDWEGADLRVGFHSGDVYDVFSNGRTSVSVDVASGQPNLRNRLTDAQIEALADKSYILRDDEISSLEKSADDTLARAIFAKAYIEVALMPQSMDQTRVAFAISKFSTFKDLENDPARTLDRRNLMGPALYTLEAQARSTPDYWTVQLVSAFDGNPESDFDPRNEFNLLTRKEETKGNLGLTKVGSCFDGATKLGGCKPHAAVFLETIRDLIAKPPRGYSDLASEGTINQRATAHELLHAFNVVHDEAIMCANVMINKAAKGGLVTDVHLKTLRELSEPTVSQSRSQTCQ